MKCICVEGESEDEGSSNSMIPEPRLKLVSPWIVACPIPLVSAHLLYTVFCPVNQSHSFYY